MWDYCPAAALPPCLYLPTSAPQSRTCSHRPLCTQPSSPAASQGQPMRVRVYRPACCVRPCLQIWADMVRASRPSNTHWIPLTTLFYQVHSHLQEVPSFLTCLHTSPPSIAISFTQLCTSPRTDGLIKSLSSILKATLIDGQAKLQDISVSLKM